MSVEIDDQIQDHEKRISRIEVSEARMDERIQALVESTNNLKKSTWGFSLIMLLTLIYLLLGRQGFKDVTGATIPNFQTIEQLHHITKGTAQ